MNGWILTAVVGALGFGGFLIACAHWMTHAQVGEDLDLHRWTPADDDAAARLLANGA